MMVTLALRIQQGNYVKRCECLDSFNCQWCFTYHLDDSQTLERELFEAEKVRSEGSPNHRALPAAVAEIPLQHFADQEARARNLAPNVEYSSDKAGAHPSHHPSAFSYEFTPHCVVGQEGVSEVLWRIPHQLHKRSRFQLPMTIQPSSSAPHSLTQPVFTL